MLFFPLYERRGLTPYSRSKFSAHSTAKSLSGPAATPIMCVLHLDWSVGRRLSPNIAHITIKFRRTELRSNSGSSSVLLNENLLRLASDLDIFRKKNVLELTPFNAIFLH